MLRQQPIMCKVRIIAVDLDGTLLDPNKHLSKKDAESLQRAAASEIEIVPATGRYYSMMPDEIQNLPYLHYAITVNGAAVLDIRRQKTICKAELPLRQALEIMGFLDRLPVIYDCYMDNQGWMTQSFQESVEMFAPDHHYLKLLREKRHPVPELKAFLQLRGKDIQKIQCFVRRDTTSEELRKLLRNQFPETSITSSVRNNVEINDPHANKGEALENLASYLRIDVSETMGIGDGLNDISLIQKAGIGVAMGNASDEVKKTADFVTEANNASGVAYCINRYCFSKKGDYR